MERIGLIKLLFFVLVLFINQSFLFPNANAYQMLCIEQAPILSVFSQDAYSAIPDASLAIFANPAIAAQSEKISIGIGINSLYSAIPIPHITEGGSGVEYIYASIPIAKRFGFSFSLENSVRRHELIDEWGANIGEDYISYQIISCAGSAILLTRKEKKIEKVYEKYYAERDYVLSFGLSAKTLIYKALNDFDTILAFDTGLNFRPIPEISASFTAKNIGLSLVHRDLQLPLRLYAAIALIYKGMRASIGLGKERGNEFELSIGIEESLFQKKRDKGFQEIAFSAGFMKRLKKNTLFTISFGLSAAFKINKLTPLVQYAFEYDRRLGLSHRLMLSLYFIKSEKS